MVKQINYGLRTPEIAIVYLYVVTVAYRCFQDGDVGECPDCRIETLNILLRITDTVNFCTANLS